DRHGADRTDLGGLYLGFGLTPRQQDGGRRDGEAARSRCMRGPMMPVSDLRPHYHQLLLRMIRKLQPEDRFQPPPPLSDPMVHAQRPLNMAITNMIATVPLFVEH